MPSRHLPEHPDLDQLKRQAKALRTAFHDGDADAVARVSALLGPKTALKLTEAQRVLAREYGFPNWARLRAHVLAAGSLDGAVRAFFDAVVALDADRARALLRTGPAIAGASLHVAAVLGLAVDVRRLIAGDRSRVQARLGDPPGDPLLWLCYSPFHGESAERDAGLAASARALLDAGADPATRDGRHAVPALYAVTGLRSVPAIARMLLEAGAPANDGESLFHAAERFHEEALGLLLAHGADVNFTGDWGNTPLHFLISHHDVAREPHVGRGVQWLLDHGADPDVRSGRDRETALHAAARTGQQPAVVELLLAHGADAQSRRADGRTAWVLARRGGFDGVVAVLETAGAEPGTLSPVDALLAACASGDADRARAAAASVPIADLDPADLQLLPDAAEKGRLAVVRACLGAGFPVGATGAAGATPLHLASIHGHAAIVRELLRAGADIHVHDPEHDSAPLGWAFFGADFVREPNGDYEDCVRALLEAGARPSDREHAPEDPDVRRVLERDGPF